MNTDFGPWAIGMQDAHCSQLNRFWKRRLQMLQQIRNRGVSFSWRQGLWLAVLGAVTLALPTWNQVTVAQSPSSESTSDERDQRLQALEKKLESLAAQLNALKGSQQAPAEKPRKYKIECKAKKTEEKGEKKIFAAPVIVTTENQTAQILIGNEKPLVLNESKGRVRIEWVEIGFSVNVNLQSLEKGRVWMNLLAGHRKLASKNEWPLPNSGDDYPEVAEIRTHATRIIRAVNLGQPFVVDLDDPEIDQIEVTITEVDTTAANSP